MCMNCGCGQPDERHGKPENLTADDLRRAGDANGQSLRTTAQHILQAVDIVEGGNSDSAPKGRTEPLGRGETGGALAEPAGRRGASQAPRGTPASES